jgi:hypothetical protein
VTARSEAKYERLVAEVARGEEVKVAARAIGIAERTAYEWSRSAEFKGRVRSIQRELLKDLVGQLSARAEKALKTMEDLLNPATPPAVRLGAARAIISSLVEIQSHTELIDRVAELEARLSNEHRNPPRTH